MNDNIPHVGISNRLTVIAADIRDAHLAQLGDLKDIGERAIRIGNLLIEAKDSVPHGGWLGWLSETGLSERTAQRYMRLARHGVKSDTVSDLGLNRSLSELSAGPVDFDLPDHGEHLMLTNRDFTLVAWIWPAQQYYPEIFYWILIADLQLDTLGFLRRPCAPFGVHKTLQLANFSTDDIAVHLYAQEIDTKLEEMIFRELAS